MTDRIPDYIPLMDDGHPSDALSHWVPVGRLADRERELLEPNNRYLEEARIARRAAEGGFQARVDPWLIACFREEIARDRQERSQGEDGGTPSGSKQLPAPPTAAG